MRYDSFTQCRYLLSFQARFPTGYMSPLASLTGGQVLRVPYVLYDVDWVNACNAFGTVQRVLWLPHKYHGQNVTCYTLA